MPFCAAINALQIFAEVQLQNYSHDQQTNTEIN